MIGRVPKCGSVVALCCLAAAGCVAVNSVPTGERPVAVAPAPAAAPVPAPAPAPEPAAPAPEPAPAPVANSAQPAAPAPAPAPSKSTNTPAAPAPPKATTAPAPQVAVPNAPPAPVAATPSAATLDFTSLVARLRATKAIGVLTKLLVKNQSDDLLEKFRAYHKRQGTASLAELHSAYEGLMLKLLALLQDGDPPLATDIDRSRAAIWDILADPTKFVQSNLMAGASR